MNTELTEREQKILEYVQRLIIVLSILSAYAENHRYIFNWMTNEMNNIRADDLVDYLKTEFNLNYRKVTDDELFGNNNKTT